MLAGEAFYLVTDKNPIACSMLLAFEPTPSDSSNNRASIPCLLQISNYRLTFIPQISSLSSSSRKGREITPKSDSIGDLARKGKLTRSNELLRQKDQLQGKDTKDMTHSTKVGKDKGHTVVCFCDLPCSLPSLSCL